MSLFWSMGGMSSHPLEEGLDPQMKVCGIRTSRTAYPARCERGARALGKGVTVNLWALVSGLILHLPTKIQNLRNLPHAEQIRSLPFHVVTVLTAMTPVPRNGGPAQRSCLPESPCLGAVFHLWAFACVEARRAAILPRACDRYQKTRTKARAAALKERHADTAMPVE